MNNVLYFALVLWFHLITNIKTIIILLDTISRQLMVHHYYNESTSIKFFGKLLVKQKWCVASMESMERFIVFPWISQEKALESSKKDSYFVGFRFVFCPFVLGGVVFVLFCFYLELLRCPGLHLYLH